jgi:hypothetical protein
MRSISFVPEATLPALLVSIALFALTQWSRIPGLWGAPLLSHIEGLEHTAVVWHRSIMTVAASVGALPLGALGDRLRRQGVSRLSLFDAISGSGQSSTIIHQPWRDSTVRRVWIFGSINTPRARPRSERRIDDQTATTPAPSI